MSLVSNAPVLLPSKYLDLLPAFDRIQRDIVAVVEGKADTAQDTADSAQADATLSLGQVQALAEANADALKRNNFLRHWYAGG